MMVTCNISEMAVCFSVLHERSMCRIFTTPWTMVNVNLNNPQALAPAELRHVDDGHEGGASRAAWRCPDEQPPAVQVVGSGEACVELSMPA